MTVEIAVVERCWTNTRRIVDIRILGWYWSVLTGCWPILTGCWPILSDCLGVDRCWPGVDRYCLILWLSGCWPMLCECRSPFIWRSEGNKTVDKIIWDHKRRNYCNKQKKTPRNILLTSIVFCELCGHCDPHEDWLGCVVTATPRRTGWVVWSVRTFVR